MPPRSKTNLRLSEAVEKYLTRISNEGQSNSSQYTARHALARFQKTVATKRDPDPYLHLITSEVMDDYCYGVDGIRAGIKAVSFNRYRSVLVNFFNHGVNLRWTDVSPMEGISPARPDAQVSRLLLSATEMMSMLDLAANPVERVALSIGMNTGLRANDIRHLTIFDASLSTGTIQTEIRKTRKLDVKPITFDLYNELVRWLDLYASLTGLESRADLPNTWLLVPSYRLPAPKERNRRLVIKPTQVHTHPWRMVQRPLAKMGYPTVGEGFHTLRRSSARALFESLRESGEGRDHALMIVKDFLNHASVTQTEHYLGMNMERTIRDALMKDQPFLSRLAEGEQEKIREVQDRNREHHNLRQVRQTG